jgi:hypothetical protein
MPRSVKNYRYILDVSALIEFLRERWEIFAWCPSDMPGVPKEFVEHALNVDPKARTVKQPLRRFDEPKRRAIAAELYRLKTQASSEKSRHQHGCPTQ